jgi:hypothetical protein
MLVGMSGPKWGELPEGQRRLIVVAGTIQVGLALTAWADLIRRPAVQVAGPKPVWAAVIALNTVGPLAYFKWGRRRRSAD